MADNQTPSIERLDERLANVMTALGEVKTRLDQVPTRAEIAALVSRSEHSTAVAALETRIGTLEAKVAEASPKSRMALVREICLTIAAIGAAAVIVVNIVHWIERIPEPVKVTK